MARPPLELTTADHGMNPIAAGLHDSHREICGTARISPWEFCEALMNAAAWILADSEGLPEAEAMKRIDDLRDVAKAAYRERKHG